jgi:hypothetical protein
MLIRILCILATTIGLHIASTAPNVADFDTEKPISTNSFELMLSSKALRKAQKVLHHFPTLALKIQWCYLDHLLAYCAD